MRVLAVFFQSQFFVVSEVGDGKQETGISRGRFAQNFLPDVLRPDRTAQHFVQVMSQVGVRVRVTVRQVDDVIFKSIPVETHLLIKRFRKFFRFKVSGLFNTYWFKSFLITYKYVKNSFIF